MRIFVNNVDGHLAGAICADLSKISQNIIGTRKGPIDDLVPPHPVIEQVVPRLEVRTLLKTIASCDVVVYDLHDADFEELELVLRVLHQSEISTTMMFIIISSVGVWARTARECEPLLEEMQPETVSGIPERVAEETPEQVDAAAAVTGDPPADGVGIVGDETEDAEVAPSEPVDPPRPPRPKPLNCEDYIRRMPAPKFQEWRTIETLTLSLKEKGAIRPYVVCAGLPYGNGEDCFFSLFRAAWQSLPTLRVIGSGHNTIPLVHVRDAARLVRHVVEERPVLDYHLAVDRGDATQREIVQAVADEFGIDYRIRSVSIPEALLAEMADMLTLDLRLNPSPLMMAPPAPAPPSPVEEPPSRSPSQQSPQSSPTPGPEPEQSIREGGKPAELEDPNAVAAPQSFRWWCESGLASNIGAVGNEFRRWRRLVPVRICVCGPPGSATSEVGSLIAQRYNLVHVAFEEVVEHVRNLPDSALSQQVRDKQAEIESALANPKSSGPFAMPGSLACKVVHEVISGRKPCQFRGYVLSGFPQFVEDAQEFYMEEVPVVATEEKKEVKKGKKGDEAPEMTLVLREEMQPDGVLVISSPEEACLRRAQKPDVSEEQWMPSFRKRTERWQKETVDGQPGLAEFFQNKLHFQPVLAEEPPLPQPPPAAPDEQAEQEEMNAAVNEAEAEYAKSLENFVETVAAELSWQIEATKEVNNFMPPPPGRKAPEQPTEQKEESVVDELAAQREEEELRRKREREEKIEQIRKDELSKLDKHSEPLRQYLMGFVVPTVTNGLIEVCRTQPEDPVGFLAEYLGTYTQLSRKKSKPRPSALASNATSPRCP